MQKTVAKSSDTLILEAIGNLGNSLGSRLEEQSLAFSKAQIKQEEFNRTVITELAEIKQNTITIMGCVVTDFKDITKSTKSEIESFSQELESFPAEVAHDYATDKVARREIDIEELGIASVGSKGGIVFKQQAVKVGQIALEYDPSLTISQRKALGNWIGNIINKIYPSTKFAGKYHPKLRGLVTALIGYYVAERSVDSTRMY